MIQVKVKTIYKGQVAIHEKYLENATRRGIQIVLKDRGMMSIPVGEVKQRINGRSHEPFIDKYSDEPYHLYYFKWQPDKEVQTKLI